MTSDVAPPVPDASAAYAAGAAALRRGRPDEALPHLRRALEKVGPDQETEVRLALAVAFRRLGDPRRAAEEYAHVAAGRPGSAEAWLNLGAARADAGDLSAATEALARARELDPAALPPRRALARVLNDLGRGADAQAECEAGLRQRPDDPPLVLSLARALKLQGRPERCAAVLRRGLAATPDDPRLLFNLAGALKDDGRTDEALAVLRDLVARHPDDGAARLLLCTTYLPALYAAEDEVERRREDYARALADLSRWVERRPAALADAVGVSQPFHLPYQGRNDRELQAAYGRMVARAMAAVRPPAVLPPPPSIGEKVRVGVVSGFFRAHANWRMPIEGWARGLDRNRFRLFGYHTSGEQDATTAEAATLFERFVQGPLPTERWREEIAADAPHVLIHPEVGMDPAALRLAAQRLAPLQCASWGHPVTTGLPTMDLFLSSDAMEPMDGQDAYTERLVRLPGLSTVVRRRGPPRSRSSRAELGLPEAGVVFWCGQSPFKYLPRQLDFLARIAAEAPDAVFVFAAFPGSDRLTALFAARVVAAFQRRPPARAAQVRVLPRMTAEAFTAAMATADVVLDSLDWSGCNTLVEAVEAGLPIVTTPGRFMRARHGAALLSVMGLEDRVCRDADDYVATAVRLSRDPEARSAFAALIASRRSRLFEDTRSVEGLNDVLDVRVR